MNDSKIIIGPSNGWLYAHNIFSLHSHKFIVRRGSANAIELCLSDDPRRIASLRESKGLEGFDFITLHLPDYGSELSIETIVAIVKKQKAAVSLIHPLGVPAEFFESLRFKEINVAIENMDKRETSGYLLKELASLLNNFKLKFVLDVQHAFEHDPSMEYAWDLFQMAKHALSYFHVSGESDDSIHALVHKAKNSKTIVNFLGKVIAEKCLPLILEGEYTNSEELRKEIEFLKAELDCSAGKC